MKKFFLISSIFSCAFAYSQMSLQKLDGTVINNGAVFTYGTYDTDDSSLHFTVKNTSSSEPIRVSIQCEKLNNTDGFDFEFCFGGNCMPFVVEGQNYPSTAYLINPNGNSGDSDHFWNRTNYETPMSIVFKVFQVDDLGNEIGEPIRVTYAYDKNLAVNDANTTNDVLLKNTMVTSNLEITSKINSNYQLFDMNSKLVKQGDLKSGNNTIDVQNLTKGIYILNLKKSNGKNQTMKIIKK